MTTETQQTADAATDTAQTTSGEKEVTLDDVYRDAGLDKIAATDTQDTTTSRKDTSTSQDTTQQTKGEPSSIPDPYDQEAFKAYLAREAAGKTELEKAVKAMAGYLTAEQQKRVVEQTRADIDKAVSTINEVVAHPKPKVIEAALDGMVREDARLKAIWANRGKNPGAWQNALKIVTKQIAEDFQVKVDPALVAAQRARKESQKQMATTSHETANPVEEDLGKAQGADFDIAWQRLVSGGA